MLLDGRLVVASAGCKVVVDVMIIIIIRRAMAAGLISEIQYWLVLHSCQLLINIVVLTPALVLSTMRDKARYTRLKTSPFHFLVRLSKASIKSTHNTAIVMDTIGSLFHVNNSLQTTQPEPTIDK